MEEAELLHHARLSSSWVDEFVVESNKIDPQPGPNEPGTLVFDGHREAVIYAIRMASEDRYAVPNAVHKLLLRDHPLAGELRSQEVKIGLNKILSPTRVPLCFWRWNRAVHEVIDALRTDDASIDADTKITSVWDLHCEFENIHPYDLYNGKVGRILMINHALLVDVEPWLISCEVGREGYFDVIRSHESALWGVSPPAD